MSANEMTDETTNETKSAAGSLFAGFKGGKR